LTGSELDVSISLVPNASPAASRRWRTHRNTRQWGKRTNAAYLDRLLTDGTEARAHRRRWDRAHRRRVLLVDVVVIAAVVTLAQIGCYQIFPAFDTAHATSWPALTVLSIVMGFCWLAALGLVKSREMSLIGVGIEEYRRVVSATAWIFGLTAVVAALADVRMPRGYLIIALTLGMAGLVTGRHLLHRDLARRRVAGKFITRVVVLGQPESVRLLGDSFGRCAAGGFRVVGACVPGFDGQVGEELLMPTGPVPVLGDDTAVESALEVTGADAVAVTSVEKLGQQNMRKLLWRLQTLETELIVVPGVSDVAGHRLRLLPVDNLPLVHIAAPRQDGPSLLAKRVFDVVFATAALIAILPLMVLVAIAIKLDDGGPVMFRQSRVGYRGKHFRIFKFRTMRVDADVHQVAERQATGHTGVFYKSACDSRITRAGRLLRATSLDELPQLFNVLGGSMSVVGPRPLVPGEGESVDHFVERRGLVKPGITGLWQISGRSDVSDEERIRLDHSYVDNWSCAQDLHIVWRTVSAVLKRDGAY
jgi:exopolysaccharide biosynthesis polyprenyl glycosylphosphotransferase